MEHKNSPLQLRAGALLMKHLLRMQKPQPVGQELNWGFLYKEGLPGLINIVTLHKQLLTYRSAPTKLLQLLEATKFFLKFFT
jgi:hypothetical protein